MMKHILDRQAKLQHTIHELQQKLALYPPEHLCIARNGNYYKYFKSDGHTSTYVPKKERRLAVELAHKKWDSCRLEESLQELNLVNTFIARYNNLPKLSEKLLDDTAFRSLYQVPTTDFFDVLQHWCQADYARNPYYPEQLQHRCISGEYVRSKSEVIIANALFTNHIPYRYECELSLGNKTYYPDFTIMHPTTAKIIYWEHFGMMDVPGYSKNAFEKLKFYSQHNIIPDINLITTYETSAYPIDSEKVQRHVQNLLDLF